LPWYSIASSIIRLAKLLYIGMFPVSSRAYFILAKISCSDTHTVVGKKTWWEEDIPLKPKG